MENAVAKTGAVKRLEAAYTGGRRAKLAVFLLGVGGYWALTMLCGASPLVFPAVALCAGVYLVLPGLLLARWLVARAALPKAMLWPVALLCGACFLCLCYLPAVRFWRPFLNLAPLPVAAFSALREWQRMRGRRASREGSKKTAAPPDVLCYAALLGLLLVAYGFAGPAANALPSVTGGTALHQDLLWNVGNAAALKNNFPPWDIRFVGVRLRYHFFTDLLCAIFSMLSGFSCFEVALFGQQPLMLAGTLVALRGMGLVFFENSHRRGLAYALLLFLAASASGWWPLTHVTHPFGNSFIVHLLTNINAQTTVTLLFGVFFGLFACAARQRFAVKFWHAALLLLCFGVMCVAKGPAASILVCAVVLALCLAALGGQGKRRPTLVLAGCFAAVFAVAYLLLYTGSAESHLLIEPEGTLMQGALGGLVAPLRDGSFGLLLAACVLLWLAQTLLMLPAPVAVSVASFATEAREFFRLRLSADVVLCYLAAGGGMLAFFLFNQQSFSQVYFFFVAVLALGLLTVRRIGPQWPKNRVLRGAVLALAAVSLFTAACTYAGFGIRGAQVLSGEAAQSAEVEAVVTPADEAAAMWLQDNTTRADIFATNRIGSGEGFAGVAHTYSALSERQGHMEGYRYSTGFGAVEWYELEDRVAANAALFDAATPPEEVARIAGERGIGYLVYFSGSEGSDAQLQGFEKVFDGEGTDIYRVAN